MVFDSNCLDDIVFVVVAKGVTRIDSDTYYRLLHYSVMWVIMQPGFQPTQFVKSKQKRQNKYLRRLHTISFNFCCLYLIWDGKKKLMGNELNGDRCSEGNSV